MLILCPFRGTALKIIGNIRNILGDNTSMSNKEKFEEEFGAPDDDSDSDDEDEISETASGKTKRKSKKRKEGLEKPDDWKALFKGDYISYYQLSHSPLLLPLSLSFQSLSLSSTNVLSTFSWNSRQQHI